jgi:hypothetical protein
MKYKRKPKLKKSKTRYRFQADNETIIGSSDDPCRTAIAFWNCYGYAQNKIMAFDIDKSRKIGFNYSLKFSDINNKKKYEYQNNIITRKEFILLLGCDA